MYIIRPYTTLYHYKVVYGRIIFILYFRLYSTQQGCLTRKRKMAVVFRTSAQTALLFCLADQIFYKFYKYFFLVFIGPCIIVIVEE